VVQGFTFSILPIPALSGAFRIPTQTSPLLSQSMTFCQYISSLAPSWLWHVFKHRLRLHYRPCRFRCASCN